MALVSPILSLTAARTAAACAPISARPRIERKGFSDTHRSEFQGDRPCSIFGAGEAPIRRYSTGIPVLAGLDPDLPGSPPGAPPPSLLLGHHPFGVHEQRCCSTRVRFSTSAVSGVVVLYKQQLLRSTTVRYLVPVRCPCSIFGAGEARFRGIPVEYLFWRDICLSASCSILGRYAASKFEQEDGARVR